MNTTVQIRQRGVVTLPVELRQKYNIEEGDTYRLVDLEGIFILTPMVTLVPELVREIEEFRLEAGIGTEELIKGIREQRKRYYDEKNAD